MNNMLHACADYTLAHSLDAPTTLSDGINNLIMVCVDIVINHHLLLASNDRRCRVGPDITTYTSAEWFFFTTTLKGHCVMF